MNKERMKELDVLRVIGFIFVVAQHILGGYSWRSGAAFSDSLVLSFLYVIAKPAVPIFIAVTAMSLCHAYLERINVIKFYQNRFLYIFLPYVSWTIINIYDTQYYDHQGSFDHFFGQLLAGTGRYHLWYMSLILQIYLLFPLILWIAGKIIKKGKVFQAGFLVVFSALYVILLTNNEVMDAIARFVFVNPTINQLRFFEVSPLLWSIYLVIGIYMFAGNKKFKELLQRFHKQLFVVYLLLLAYMYYAEIGSHLPVHYDIESKYINCTIYVSFMVVSIFVFYHLGCYISSQMPRLYFLLSKTAGNTYTAYLAHVIVLQSVAEEITKTYELKSFLESGLSVFFLTVAFSLIMAEFFSLLPFSQVIFGTKNKYYPRFDQIIRRFGVYERQSHGKGKSSM
ncbi:MAG: acyltransferase [Peptococcaceae bacterium]|nr:acyltransferase [Peptococcaceae bacterium]